MGHARTCSLLLGVVGAFWLGHASADTPPPSSAVEPLLAVRLDGAAGQAVRRAVLGARRRLADPACRQVLTDFHDDSGRPLADVLSDLSVSPADYLGLVVFYDGSSRSRCRSGEVLASTRPGSRVVWVCSHVFRSAEARDPRLAEVMVIHETLHTLGLGERPSGSVEITQAILDRCQNKPDASAASVEAPACSRATGTAN